MLEFQKSRGGTDHEENDMVEAVGDEHMARGFCMKRTSRMVLFQGGGDVTPPF